nr:hypothetical protein [Tanacetum cinerariifolium]
DIITSYGDVVTLKRDRDDQEKDEDPFAGSNRGSKRNRSGKESESSKEPTHKESKSTSSSKGERYALNVALRMFTRQIGIQERVEDLQLGVKSYQKKINLTRPDTYHSDLKRMTPYTTYPDIQGIIYEDEMNRNRLMRTDELHKF